MGKEGSYMSDFLCLRKKGRGPYSFSPRKCGEGFAVGPLLFYFGKNWGEMSLWQAPLSPIEGRIEIERG